jgi:tRNA (guanine-N7-)-methyltransferase
MIKYHNCNIIQSISDIYKQGEPDFPLNIQTFYEGMHLAEGRTIYYVNFELPENPIEIPPKKKKYEEEASV